LNPFRTKKAPELNEWDEFLLRYNRKNPNNKWAPSRPSPFIRLRKGEKPTKLTARQYEDLNILRARIIKREIPSVMWALKAKEPTKYHLEKVKKAMDKSNRLAREIMKRKLLLK